MYIYINGKQKHTQRHNHSLTHVYTHRTYITSGLPASCDFGENQNMQILFAYLQESTSTNVIENTLTATFTFLEMHIYYPRYNFRCSRSHAEQPERHFREVTFLTALPLPLLASTKPPRRCIRVQWPAVGVGMLATHNVPKTPTPIIAQRAIDDRTMFPALDISKLKWSYFSVVVDEVAKSGLRNRGTSKRYYHNVSWLKMTGGSKCSLGVIKSSLINLIRCDK